MYSIWHDHIRPITRNQFHSRLDNDLLDQEYIDEFLGDEENKEILENYRREIEAITRTINEAGVKALGVERSKEALERERKYIAVDEKEMDDQLTILGVPNRHKVVDEILLLLYGPTIYMEYKKNKILDGMTVFAFENAEAYETTGNNHAELSISIVEMIKIADRMGEKFESIEAWIKKVDDMYQMGIPLTRIKKTIEVFKTEEMKSAALKFVDLMDKFNKSVDARDPFIAQNSYEALNKYGNTLITVGRLHRKGIIKHFNKLRKNENEKSRNREYSGEKSDSIGGIDLNPNLLKLNIRRDENNVPMRLNINPTSIENININGLQPVIINIVPVTLPMILGDVDDADDIDSIVQDILEEKTPKLSRL